MNNKKGNLHMKFGLHGIFRSNIFSGVWWLKDFSNPIECYSKTNYNKLSWIKTDERDDQNFAEKKLKGGESLHRFLNENAHYFLSDFDHF